ncbi:unnamed protein product [Linum trigynum]|uniref:Uncharacterized protein n=1 Tax=Linum trigynum TaxID=586398 RepID=A0AAV2DWN6_9ROSI
MHSSISTAPTSAPSPSLAETWESMLNNATPPSPPATSMASSASVASLLPPTTTPTSFESPGWSSNPSHSPTIDRLTELKELSLPDNRLVDKIRTSSRCSTSPTTDSRAKFRSPGVPFLLRLRVLNLASNKLSGDLNFLKHFPNLETLSLSNNFSSARSPNRFAPSATSNSSTTLREYVHQCGGSGLVIWRVKIGLVHTSVSHVSN